MRNKLVGLVGIFALSLGLAIGVAVQEGGSAGHGERQVLASDGGPTLPQP